jgi:hypothetical protein
MNESMDRVLADWLQEGPEEGPREGLERSLAMTRRVTQRPGWTLAERWIPMELAVARTRVQRPILAIVMLALLIVAVVAATLFVGAQQQPPLPRGMWPQGTVEEARAAQALADAGDPAYAWQVDSSWSIDDDPLIGTEISERFLREGLGWEESIDVGSAGYIAAGGADANADVFLRCAPGRTNPISSLYRDLELEIRGCAPTLDDFHYEAVTYGVGQPVRSGPTGLWVVTWAMLPPAEQETPPSDTEANGLLRAFLAARVDGEGAEKYLLRRAETAGLPFVDGEAPLLHAATGGSRYARSEFERVQGPVWPAGWTEFKVRLFAEDGTVVDQHFVVVRQENGRLGLVYGPASEYGDPPTIEDGQALYSLLDGEVTVAAARTWNARAEGPTRMDLGSGCRGTGFCSDNVSAVADPSVLTGCEAGPAPADADALARNIRANTDLASSAPEVVSVGGIKALRMDVWLASGADVCDKPMALNGLSLRATDRMRLYLVDFPGGSARVLAVAVIARDPHDKAEVSQQEFERVVEAATPIVESIEFHTR